VNQVNVSRKKRGPSIGWQGWLFAGALILLMTFTLFPFYWAIVASLTPEAALFRDPSLWPTVSMFPQISIVSPLYLLLRSLRLIDTYPGLIMPYMTFAMPLTVWVLTGSIRQIPKDLEEAAHVDGATRRQSFTRILLPLAVPSLATTGILTFIYCWNEFLFALSFTLGPDRQTVPVAIALFRGQYQVPWGQILAAAVVATAPVAAMVLVFQRRIVQGLTAGAVKG
jgi:ABC-type glycerol-3-phosphate transport system permease component